MGPRSYSARRSLTSELSVRIKECGDRISFDAVNIDKGTQMASSLIRGRMIDAEVANW